MVWDCSVGPRSEVSGSSPGGHRSSWRRGYRKACAKTCFRSDPAPQPGGWARRPAPPRLCAQRAFARGPASRPRVRPAPRLPQLKRGFASGAEFLGCGSALGARLVCARWPRLCPVPSRAPGAMASRGRKRKAEAALAAAAEKREKPAGGQEGEVAGPSVVIEHW